MSSTKSKQHSRSSAAIAPSQGDLTDTFVSHRPSCTHRFLEAAADILKRRQVGENHIASILSSVGFDIFVRIDTVVAVVGLSIPTVYRLVAKGEFPRPVRLTNTARGWKLSDVVSWMQSREVQSPGERVEK